ncbi:hypothetical protein E2C01_096170 [Portunus trituberculatus]|uniref:Secreted protein n=1 Tax=Portunus trituberculatus TaxID=210409 RepID=A0A5B7JUX8_PORTR|nr:hypothetical protein [Portunus trituberculatus]
MERDCLGQVMVVVVVLLSRTLYPCSAAAAAATAATASSCTQLTEPDIFLITAATLTQRLMMKSLHLERERDLTTLTKHECYLCRTTVTHKIVVFSTDFLLIM